MSKLSEKRDRVMLALGAGHVARRVGDLWRWSPRWRGGPSLSNTIVAPLFQANFVTEVDGELRLTDTGIIVEQRL